MATRALTTADRATIRTFFNAPGQQAGIAAAWPGGVAPLTAADVIAIFEQPGAVNLGSFNGATLQGILCSRPEQDKFNGPGETTEAIWLMLVLSGVTDAQHRAVMAEMIVAWWTDLNSRKVTWGSGRNPLSYPLRMETLFQKIIAAGMTVAVEGSWRIVRMRPADALAVMTRLAAIP